jgi:hypothetical protein
MRELGVLQVEILHLALSLPLAVVVAELMTLFHQQMLLVDLADLAVVEDQIMDHRIIVVVQQLRQIKEMLVVMEQVAAVVLTIMVVAAAALEVLAATQLHLLQAMELLEQDHHLLYKVKPHIFMLLVVAVEMIIIAEEFLEDQVSVDRVVMIAPQQLMLRSVLDLVEVVVVELLSLQTDGVVMVVLVS